MRIPSKQIIMKNSLLIALLMLLSVSACDRSGVSNREIRKLESAQKIWQQTKTADYSFTYLKGCFCGYVGEVEIQVFADTIYAVIDPETGEEMTIDRGNGEERVSDVYKDYFLTIDELFEELIEATMIADEMEGNYDKDRGFPVHVSIDYYKDAIDDEVSHQLGNYQVLTLTKN